MSLITYINCVCAGDIQATTIPQMIILPQFPNNITLCVINISEISLGK